MTNNQTTAPTVSIRMSLLVDDLVNATHDQAPIHEFGAAKTILLQEIAALECESQQDLTAYAVIDSNGEINSIHWYSCDVGVTPLDKAQRWAAQFGYRVVEMTGCSQNIIPTTLPVSDR